MSGLSLTDAGGTTLYAYDARGNLTQAAVAFNSVASYTYDLGDRLTALTAPSGSAATDLWNPTVEVQVRAAEVSARILEGERQLASTAGSLLRSGDAVARSQAARLLPSIGAATRGAESLGFKVASRSLGAFGVGITYGAHLAAGNQPIEAGVRTAVDVGVTGTSVTSAAFVACGTAGAVTAGVGGVGCGLAVAGGFVFSAIVAPAVEDAVIQYGPGVVDFAIKRVQIRSRPPRPWYRSRRRSRQTAGR